jgi:hypothetical protein
LDGKESNSAESARSKACQALQQPASGTQQNVTDALSKCDDASKDATTASAELGTAVTGLQSALTGIPGYFATKVAGLSGGIQPLVTLQVMDPKTKTDAPIPPAPAIIQKLGPGLLALRQVLDEQHSFRAVWNSTKPSLTRLGTTIPPEKKDGACASPASVDDGFTCVQTSVDTVLLHLHGWVTTITKELQDGAKSLDGMISDVESDPATKSATAFGAVRAQTDTTAAVQPILDAWPPIVGYLVQGQPKGFELKTLRTDFENLKTEMNVLRGSISRMHDALAGDMSKFQTDQVSLYYFTDIPRLMGALNERTQTIGGVAEARAQASAQRTALTQAELDLADAQATVNRFQKQVLDLQEQQRQAQATLKNLNSQVSKLANRLKGAQNLKNSADTAQQKAQSDQSASPNDPTKTAALQAATARQTAAATKLSQTQSDYDAAKSDADKTQSQLDNTQNQSDSLPAKLEVAQRALNDAQTDVSRQRRNMLLAAQGESDAFAFARDNTPYLFAPADASSSDPVKRVLLYAFNDNKTIFMRGMPDDLAVVKHIIAEFDRPAPQARLTLWTFQLNTETGQKTNKKAAKALNDSMAILDEELGDSRALVNTTVTLLRDLINEQVQDYAADPTDANCSKCAPADLQKLRRLNFYDPAVLTQLRFDMTEDIDVKALRRLVPDPAGTTTLGEALLVLSLAQPEIKKRVRDDFEGQIVGRLEELPLSPKVDRTKWAATQSMGLLPLTWHALGIWEDGVIPPHNDLTASQLEICRALRTAYDYAVLHQIADQLQGRYTDLTAIALRMKDVTKQIADLEDNGEAKLSASDSKRLHDFQVKGDPSDAAQINVLIRRGINGLSRADIANYDQLDNERLVLKARQQTIFGKSITLIPELKPYGLDFSDLERMNFPGGTAGAAYSETADTYKRMLKVARLRVFESPGLNGASPRVAAADQMLKEMIIALEDDLARLFIQPMIKGLRNRLVSETRASVGVIERESMLATNRGVARIDPRASAQLQVGTEEDILSSVQQLAQLYTVVQSGGALAALGALQAQPREPQPEIIALTTGNKFEVTPIFDPSGQALRFKFDFVSTTNLQEPNGSTNPAFPRVERHTVNTEVQLSNLETREISRFESTARLGRPTQYWGGIPILKDIPYVRPWVPLVGWFVRKGGSNAVAQQSVIFGQTTMYPTIGALIDLLSDTSDMQPEQPEAIPKKKPG